jgi:hypothetical protein
VYKPNFCCECGNKTIRLRWHFWQSRRFCASCARRLRKERYLPPLLMGAALLVAGFMFGRNRVPPPPPLLIERRADSPLNDSGIGSAKTDVAATTTQAQTTEEEVYICGARTKKGTPCSRRVHGPVRCWQHKGMPAMLPQEKLKVR